MRSRFLETPVTLLCCIAIATVVACTGRATVPVELSLTGNLQSAFTEPRGLARSVAPAYVKVTVVEEIDNENERGATTGPRVISGASGILIDPAGYVMTAAHIARNTGRPARVTTLDGVEHPARVLHVDRGREMALIEIQRTDRTFEAARPGDGVQAEQPVLAIGTPGNRPGAVALGRVSAPRLEQRIAYGAFGFKNPIVLGMEVEPGFSGGPVFDEQGLLQGMIIGFDLRREPSGELTGNGRAYAIPAAVLFETAREWIDAHGNN